MKEGYYPRTDALSAAVRSGNGDAIRGETQLLVQGIANELSTITRECSPAFLGLLLVAAEFWLESLRSCADKKDFEVAAALRERSTAVTITKKE